MKTGVVATIHAVVVACAVLRPLACNHWWNVTPRKPSRAKYAHSLFSGIANCRLASTVAPRIKTPIPKRIHTIVAGETSVSAILVAINVPPQMMTAKRAERVGRRRDLGIGGLYQLLICLYNCLTYKQGRAKPTPVSIRR